MTTITLRRRGIALAGAALAIAAALTACGGGDEDTTSSVGSRAGYPVTVETEFGDLTLQEKPERIVVVGSPLDVDVLKGLGEPAAVYGAPAVGGEKDALALAPWLDSNSYGRYADGLFDDDFGPAREAIAEQDPDLVIFFGAGAPLDQQGYDRLSEVAPTYAYATIPPWRDEVSTIGRLVGKEDQAAALVADMSAEFEAARAEVPGLAGRTFLHGVATNDGIYAVPAAVQLFQELGMKPASNQPVPPGRPQTYSRENLDQVDADVVFLGGKGAPRTALEDDPRFDELPAVRNDAMVFLQPLLGDVAIPTQLGPASVPWMLERLVPELQKSPLAAGT